MVSDVARRYIVASPSHRPERWQFCGILVQTEVSVQPTLWPMDFPREQRIEMESSARPLRVSITTRINSTPANLHVERHEDNLC